MHGPAGLPTGESKDQVVVASLENVHVVLEPLAGRGPTDVALTTIRVRGHLHVDWPTPAVAAVSGVSIEEAIVRLSFDAHLRERFGQARSGLLRVTTRRERQCAGKQHGRE